jgi:hypothetical protein
MSADFPKFAKAIEAHFNEMAKGDLYIVDAVDLFDRYLAAFPEGTNPIYRVRTEHDGSYDKQFIRNVGHVVKIKGSKIETLWDVKGLPHPYDVVAAALANYIRSLPIRSIFKTKEGKFSMESNIELKDGVTTKFNHFFCVVPNSHRSATPEADKGTKTTNIGVFRRGLEELTADALETVLDLIKSNGLYRGDEHKRAVTEFLALHRAYPRGGSQAEKDVFLWSNIFMPAALFRNTVIGTLIVDISAGIDLEAAVRKFESKVAPENYKRPTALITPKMIDDGLAKLRELGLESAVERRFAKISDVSVNNVLFVDNSVKGQMKGGLEGLLNEAVKPATVDIKHAEEITMDDFLARIVPQASSIDLLLQNTHLANFMSLTAPVDPAAGQLFKWANGFAWSYDGDVTDSLKERVKAAGGNVKADFRISLGWFNFDDLDIHVRWPGGPEIYYANKQGHQDVDMNVSPDSRKAVENVVFNGRDVKDGEYIVMVHNFTKRESTDVGFELEVESRGVIHRFTHSKAVPSRAVVVALSITVKGGVVTGVKTGLNVTGGSFAQEKWGVSTETLVPVDTLMASPNHWDGQGVGNKHWFFLLKNCLNPGSARGIYNEFLKSELDPHRKVFEVLGAKSKAPFVTEQLSGVGFSSTRDDQVKVVVKGNRINKAFNISF